jgi:hypothetical protein
VTTWANLLSRRQLPEHESVAPIAGDYFYDLAAHLHGAFPADRPSEMITSQAIHFRDHSGRWREYHDDSAPLRSPSREPSNGTRVGMTLYDPTQLQNIINQLNEALRAATALRAERGISMPSHERT